MKRTILYICGIASLLGAVSCQDFLTRDPKLSQSTEITLSTYDGLNDATFGAYSALASTSWYGQQWIVDAEMRSGNGKSLISRTPEGVWHLISGIIQRPVLLRCGQYATRSYRGQTM